MKKRSLTAAAVVQQFLVLSALLALQLPPPTSFFLAHLFVLCAYSWKQISKLDVVNSTISKSSCNFGYLNAFSRLLLSASQNLSRLPRCGISGVVSDPLTGALYENHLDSKLGGHSLPEEPLVGDPQALIVFYKRRKNSSSLLY